MAHPCYPPVTPLLLDGPCIQDNQVVLSKKKITRLFIFFLSGVEVLVTAEDIGKVAPMAGATTEA
jgi:hypothetical protein